MKADEKRKAQGAGGFIAEGTEGAQRAQRKAKGWLKPLMKADEKRKAQGAGGFIAEGTEKGAEGAEKGELQFPHP